MLHAESGEAGIDYRSFQGGLFLSMQLYRITRVIRWAFNQFPDFFVQAFKIVVETWKFTMLLLYILWDDWPIFMISGSNKQLQQQLEYTLLKPDCHSWWISKMQSGRENTLEERHAIKFCFKPGRNPQKRMKCFRLLYEHLAWNEHQFLSGIIKEGRKSVSDGERCGRSKEVRTPELIGQIKNFMDKDCHVYIETIRAQFMSVWELYTQLFARNWRCGRFVQSLSKGCSEKIIQKDVVVTVGRWSSWSIQIPQFLMLWWPAMKAGSTAMTQRPVEACWLSHTQEGQTEQIHPRTFDDPFFWQHWHDLHALGSHWSDSQQGILCCGFKGVKEEITSEEASTHQIGSVAFSPGQYTRSQLHTCHRLFDQDSSSDSL